ncbi:MAG TPA: hypothetical protein VIC06_12410 [Solirubrobacteraceae bacterium]
MPADPVFVSWTLHALDKARQLGFARSDVEAAVLSGHRERRRNAGEGGLVGRGSTRCKSPTSTRTAMIR